MQALVFAFVSYFGWAVGNIFGTITTRKLGAYSSAFWILMTRALLSSIYIPFALHDLNNITANIIFINIFLGIIWIIGVIASYESLRNTNAPLAGTIVSSFPFVAVLFSIIFLKENINSNQAIAILTIFIGLVVCSVPFKDIRNRNAKINKGIFFGFIAMLCFGIYFSFIKITIQQIGWFWPGYITLLLFPIIFLLMKVRRTKLNKPIYHKGFWPILSTAALLLIGDFSYNFAISKGLSSVVAPIAGASPTLFVILAFFIFKDPMKKHQIFGIILTLIGIVSLAIFSR